MPIFARCIRYVPEHARAVRLAFRWDIESAKKRVDELSRQSDAEFVIFNEHTLQVVETFETSISF